jgi:hypothetical protein
VDAYRAAIADHYFQMVVLRYGPTEVVDRAIDADLTEEHGYTLIREIPYWTKFGAGNYRIWRRRSEAG